MRIDKLELKHIAPYLPYGLKGEIEFDGKKRLVYVLGFHDNGLIHHKNESKPDYHWVDIAVCFHLKNRIMKTVIDKKRLKWMCDTLGEMLGVLYDRNTVIWKGFDATVDFKSKKDEDWFYVENEAGYEFLINGYLKVIKSNWGNKEFLYAKKVFHYIDYSIDKATPGSSKPVLHTNVIKTLRKATPEDLALMFEKHPELAPPKVGDWGIFWNNINAELKNIKEGRIFLGEIDLINKNSEYIYEVKNTLSWKHFYKINLEKPLQPQIDEFIKKYEK